MPEILTSDGVRLHYVIDGAGGGDAVLLHHGYLKTLEHWAPFAALVAARLRVVRYDVRGAGGSGVPPEGAEWSVERLARDALELMDALGLPRVHFAGFESGGVVGMLLAAQHPERIASLACFNTPFRDASARGAAGGVFANGYASPAEAIDAMGFASWVDHLMAHDVLIDRGDPARSEWVARLAKSVPPAVAKPWHAVFWEAAAQIAALPARIRAPVLLVAGANHVHGCQPPLLDKLRAKLADARPVVYVPDVAIGVQLIKADACAAAYLAFLDREGIPNAH